MASYVLFFEELRPHMCLQSMAWLYWNQQELQRHLQQRIDMRLSRIPSKSWSVSWCSNTPLCIIGVPFYQTNHISKCNQLPCWAHSLGLGPNSIPNISFVRINSLIKHFCVSCQFMWLSTSVFLASLYGSFVYCSSVLSYLWTYS